MSSFVTGILPSFLSKPLGLSASTPTTVNQITVNKKEDAPISVGQRSGGNPARALAAGGGDSGLALDPLGKRGRGAVGRTSLLGR